MHDDAQASLRPCHAYGPWWTRNHEMVITSSRISNWTPSLMTKWRTRGARTQLQFTARDHEFTSWMHRGSTGPAEPLLRTTTTNMAAANFVVKFVITNGEGCALTRTADRLSTNSVPRSFFPRVAIGCRLSLKIDRNLEGSLIGGYMIWFGVNRRYGNWMNIYTDLWQRHETFSTPCFLHSQQENMTT